MGVLLRGVPGILEAGDGAEELVWDPEFNDTELLPKNKKGSEFWLTIDTYLYPL